MRQVTVVVPVYGDMDSLGKCILSLIRCVDKKNRILLVNDCGPQCDEIEMRIKELIYKQTNIAYFRNNQNLGFVKTCNKAVLELDDTDNDILLLNSDTIVTDGFLEEMQEVLYLCEKHGVVCPRSNNATLLSMPLKTNDECVSSKQSYQLFLKMQKYLPRYSVLPTGVGFAFLIKRDVIKMFGLFDEIYGNGYNEENDFCQRINEYGYEVVSANRAYVYHEGTKSFDENEKRKSEDRNLIKLCERYPYYLESVTDYYNRYINPFEHFADLLSDDIYEKKRILFSMYDIPAAYNGTSLSAIRVLSYFERKFNKKYEINILINHEADKLFKISEKYDKVWYPDTINTTFHLAYSNSQIFNMEHLIILNRVALKYIVCLQDIISLRSRYILNQYPDRYDVFYKSIKYADGITSISEYSMNDTFEYFSNLPKRESRLCKVIYMAEDKDIESKEDKKTDIEIQFEEYFFAYGNRYRHKFIDKIMPVLKELPYNFVVLGTTNTGRIAQNIYGCKSGTIDSKCLDDIISESRGLIFPSVYEGFGLPILDSLKYRKRIVVKNNQLNRELKETFDNSDNILLYDDMQDFVRCIDKINAESLYCISEKRYERQWDDVAAEIETLISDVLDREIDKNILLERWNDLKCLEREDEMRRKSSGVSLKQKFLVRFPKTGRLLVKIKRKVMKKKER